MVDSEELLLELAQYLVLVLDGSETLSASPRRSRRADHMRSSWVELLRVPTSSTSRNRGFRRPFAATETR